MYAVLRSDLEMNHGKAASQAGHAFLDSFLASTPSDRESYFADGGTKIVLSVKGEQELCELMYQAKMARLPCAMVVEEHHVHPPHFDGSPVPTALGVGPVRRSAARKLMGGLPLLR